MYIQYRAGDNFFFWLSLLSVSPGRKTVQGDLIFPTRSVSGTWNVYLDAKSFLHHRGGRERGGGRGKWHVCVSGLIQRIEYDEGVMGRCSRWWHEMNRREKSDIRNLNNHVSGTAGEQNSAGSLNRQPNRPNKNHLPRPSTPVLKGLGKEKWGNPPLHCTDHAFNLRSIHPRSNHLNTICLLVH